MSVLIVDIADEIYRELAEPEDVSIPSIGFWLRTNIGKLNILVDKSYTISETTLEIIDSVKEPFGINESAIYKKMYNIHYYERQIYNLIGKSRNVNIINTPTSGNYGNLQISENGFTYNREGIGKTSSETIRANTQFLKEMGSNFASLKEKEVKELNSLLSVYTLNEVNPLQVAGDDIIEGYDGNYSYGNHNRNIEN
jgi:hypothetical protein